MISPDILNNMSDTFVENILDNFPALRDQNLLESVTYNKRANYYQHFSLFTTMTPDGLQMCYTELVTDTYNKIIELLYDSRKIDRRGYPDNHKK